jgi:hypothetical protein
MAFVSSNRSLPEIFVDVVNQLTMLVRKEAQLARVEMSEKIGKTATGFALVVGGSVLLIPALVILLQAAVTALVDAGLAMVWATLIVGGGALVIGLLLLGIGVTRLKAGYLVPTKTIEQLQLDAAVAKHQMRSNHGIPERAA